MLRRNAQGLAALEMSRALMERRKADDRHRTRLTLAIWAGIVLGLAGVVLQGYVG